VKGEKEMKNKEKYQESLSRAVNGVTGSNYPAIIHGLVQKGIPQHDIQPRENVFTYNAWKALGRHVKKGEHGVRVVTFIQTDKTEIDKATGEEVKRHSSYPSSTTVFHITQTEANTK